MKTRAFGVLLALAVVMPATVFAQGVPRLTVGRMEVKDSAKFITIKSSPWVVGSCPGGEGKAAYNPGYELWDTDGYKESHWGFGALRLSTEKSGARFFGSVSKWPTKGERVLMGYAKSAGGAVTVGGKALGKNWQLIKIPFSGGKVPDTLGGSGTGLLDDWIMGDHFTTIEYSVDGKDVSSVELYRIVPPQPGARRVRKNTAVLVRKDNVPDGLTIKIKAEGTDTTLRYFFKVNRRTGGTVKILYPTNADSLLRASIPLKHAITARLRTTVLKNIMFYDEPKAAQIQITSVANRQLKGKVKMYLVDFWGKIVDTQSFAINMKPGGRFAKNYTIPKGLRGYFTGAFEIKIDKGETLWLIPRSFGSPDPTGAEGEPKFPP
ncbi:MAG: hypothetical protein QF662_03760, partial [Phycisphaerae bacterium]|nr:hypothetical protein [Phycisphaerae bacterium]